MRTSTQRATSTLAVATALFASAGCDHTIDGAARDVEGLKDRAAERADQAGRAAEVELVRFTRGADDALAEVDAKLEKIRHQTAVAGTRLKQDTAQQIDALKAERDELARKIDQAAVNAHVEWEATKRSLDESIAELGRGADEILDDLGDNVRESTQ